MYYKIKVDWQSYGKSGYSDLQNDYEWAKPLIFPSVEEADQYLRNALRVTPNERGSHYSSDANPYHLAHNQYGVPDYKIVSANSGRQSEPIRATVRQLMG